MSDTTRVRTTLASEGIHRAWADSFRTADNEAFFELAFEHIVRALGAPKGATLLDAGCGSGRHSIRLARRGFDVTGIDFSDFVLEAAKRSAEELGLREHAKFQRQDLLELTFPDEAFDYVLCWGVLMHVPAVEKAISELCRVLKRGGSIIISEVNAKGVEVVAQRLLRPWLGSGNVTTRRTEAGLEAWAKTPSGELLSRKTDIRWLVERFGAHGMELVQRKSGQFTESYTRLRSKYARLLVHGVNDFWFRHINLPSLACGNILIMKKRGAG
jgi:2-polyprenyl-3-methyl-5-hydroxy-6-metoxy-1,4-benzoquinol methylase